MEVVRVVNKQSRRKKRLIIALSIIGAVIFGICIFFEKNVNPMIVTVSNEQIRALANEAVSAAVLDVMSVHADTEYLTIVRDEKDAIKSVDLDSDTISSMAQEVTIAAQKKINEIGQQGIKIPIGSLSGVTFLTGLGPEINIKIVLVGSTQTQITSLFTDTGINQTLHRLYFNISGSVAVAAPGLPSNIKTSTQVLMSEMIIIGDVPPTYLDAVNVGDMLDLVAQ